MYLVFNLIMFFEAFILTGCIHLLFVSHLTPPAIRWLRQNGIRLIWERLLLKKERVFHQHLCFIILWVLLLNWVLQVPKFLSTTPDLTSVCPETLILAAPEQLNRWH